MDEKTQSVDFDYVKNSISTSYIDDDVIVLDHIPKLPDNKVFKLEMLTCYGVMKGRMQFDLNGKSHQASEGDMVVCMPNSYIDNYMMSPDLCVRAVGISYSVLQRHLNISKNFWNVIEYIIKNPVIHLEKPQYALLSLYSNLFRFKHSNPGGFHHKETLQLLLRCMFLEIASIIMPKLGSEPESGVIRHGDQLFKRFLELLSASEGRERSVKSYAEQLCITPKYLSTLSKTASGKPALEWIHRFTAEAIERRLKYTDKSVKEISDEMNFPNLSFFGKFTKAHLGLSPTEYRRRLNDM